MPQRRSATYKKEDLQRLKAEVEEVEPVLCAVFTVGSAVDSSEAMAATEVHRQHITRWFYDCSYDVHRGMTDMYVAYDRFRAYYDALSRAWPDSSGKRPTPTPTVPVLITNPKLTHVERSVKDVCITATVVQVLPLNIAARNLSGLSAFLSRLPTTPRGVIHPATPNVGEGVFCEVSVCGDYAEASSSRIAAT